MTDWEKCDTCGEPQVYCRCPAPKGIRKALQSRPRIPDVENPGSELNRWQRDIMQIALVTARDGVTTVGRIVTNFGRPRPFVETLLGQLRARGLVDLSADERSRPLEKVTILVDDETAADIMRPCQS